MSAWLTRQVRKGSDEHRTYLRARFPRGGGAPSPFDFDGHNWAYHFTSFDDLGEFDVLRRPNPDRPAESDDGTSPAHRIRQTTATMRRMMPNACGDWAAAIDQALADLEQDP